MRWHVQSEECMCTVRALLSKSKLCGGVSSPLPLLFLVGGTNFLNTPGA
jgi:hypothetical protein